MALSLMSGVAASPTVHYCLSHHCSLGSTSNELPSSPPCAPQVTLYYDLTGLDRPVPSISSPKITQLEGESWVSLQFPSTKLFSASTERHSNSLSCYSLVRTAIRLSILPVQWPSFHCFGLMRRLFPCCQRCLMHLGAALSASSQMCSRIHFWRLLKSKVWKFFSTRSPFQGSCALRDASRGP